MVKAKHYARDGAVTIGNAKDHNQKENLRSGSTTEKASLIQPK